MSPNVRVNCIAPGYVPTEFSSIGAGRYNDVVIKYVLYAAVMIII